MATTSQWLYCSNMANAFHPAIFIHVLLVLFPNNRRLDLSSWLGYVLFESAPTRSQLERKKKKILNEINPHGKFIICRNDFTLSLVNETETVCTFMYVHKSLKRRAVSIQNDATLPK